MKPFVKLSVAIACQCAVIGCGQSRVPSEEPTPPMPAPPANAIQAAAVDESPPPSPVSADTEPNNRGVAQFSPPFPQRMEIFIPPERTQNAARNTDEPNEMVELKGFITVDQPLAILSIDGVVTTLAEGSEKYGLRVMSIQPPSVTYQRGRSRRTVSLK